MPYVRLDNLRSVLASAHHLELLLGGTVGLAQLVLAVFLVVAVLGLHLQQLLVLAA
jgi:hypothetical protein